MKTFAVYVVQSRQTKYLVEAMTPEDAQLVVEASDDADEEFDGKDIDSTWYVDQVEEA